MPEKRLIPMVVKMQDNIWDIYSTEEGYEHFNCKTTPEKMRTALYRMKAMDGDGEECCCSSKNNTYMGMLKKLDNNEEITLHVWKSHYPKSKEDFEALLK